jgi:hypothetical protein
VKISEIPARSCYAAALQAGVDKSFCFKFAKSLNHWKIIASMPDSQPHNEPAKEVPVELVTSRGEPVKKTAPGAEKTFFHPWSGLTILGVDWLAFGADLPTGFILMPLVCIAAYIVTYILVKKIQIEQNHDSIIAARRKAIIGAIAAAVPFPITGTIFGIAILMLSGLPTSLRKAIGQVRDRIEKR